MDDLNVQPPIGPSDSHDFERPSNQKPAEGLKQTPVPSSVFDEDPPTLPLELTKPHTLTLHEQITRKHTQISNTALQQIANNLPPEKAIALNLVPSRIIDDLLSGG